MILVPPTASISFYERGQTSGKTWNVPTAVRLPDEQWIASTGRRSRKRVRVAGLAGIRDNRQRGENGTTAHEYHP